MVHRLRNPNGGGVNGIMLGHRSRSAIANVLTVALVGSLLITPVIGGIGVGFVQAASHVEIDSLAPATVEENTTTTHELDITAQDISAATDTASNDTVTISFPQEAQSISGFSISAQNGSGGAVKVYAARSTAREVIFEVNSTQGPPTLVINASISVEWGTVSAPKDGTVSVRVADSDGSTQIANGSITIEYVETTNSGKRGADNVLASGQSIWQGQKVFFDGTNVVTEDRFFNIYAVNDSKSGTLNHHITSFTVSEGDNTTKLKSKNWEAGREYIVTYQREPVVINENGVATALTEESDEASWAVVEQTLSAEFDRDFVTPDRDETATIELESNRASYRLAIEADDVEARELEAALNGSNDVAKVNENKDRVVLDITHGTSTEIEVNFSTIDVSGDIEFDLWVKDSTASTDASITVTGEKASMTFTKSVYREQVGDEVRISIELTGTDNGFVFVGGDDVNYLERIHVVDSDGDGRVTLLLNSYAAGQSSKNPGTSSTASAEEAGYEVVGEDDFGSKGITRFDSSDFNDAVQIPADLSSPLEPGVYPLRASISGEINPDSGAVDALEDEAALDLQDRNTVAVRTLVAPAETSLRSIEDIRADTTEQSTLTMGDVLIVNVEASGIYAYLDDSYDFSPAGRWDSGSPNASEHGVYLAISQITPSANREPDPLDLSNAPTYFDPENESFYVVIDTDDERSYPTLDEGQTYRVEFVVNETNAYVSDTGSGEQAVRKRTKFTIRGGTAEIIGRNESGILELPRIRNAIVAGRTPLPAGSEVRLELSSSEHTFATRQLVTIQQDGTFNTSVDVRHLPVGAQVQITVASGPSTLAETDGVVISEPRARLLFEEPSVNSSVITVNQVNLTRGGFVELTNGSDGGEVLGSSKYLQSGEHRDIQIPINRPLESNSTITATVYWDVDEDGLLEPSEDRAFKRYQSDTFARETIKLSPVNISAPVITERSNGSISLNPGTETWTPLPSPADVSTRVTTANPIQERSSFWWNSGLIVSAVALAAALLLTINRR